MTDKEIRIAIAKARGVIRLKTPEEYAEHLKECDEINKEPHPHFELTQADRWERKGPVPDYLNDLNAIMPILPEHTMITMWRPDGIPNWCVSKMATRFFIEGPDLARVACEFFLRTIGKWKD